MTGAFGPVRAALIRGGPWIVLALLALASLVGFAEPLLDLPHPVERNYNEGWNAFHAAAAMQGEGLYPSRGATVFNNYPPLSFYLVGLWGTWMGDFVVAGRLIAFLSLLVIACACGHIAFSLTRTRLAALLAGLLVTASFATWFPHYVAMNDPQLLGQAFQFTGLALLVRHGKSRAALLGATGLLLLGGLVKHMLLAVPLGVLVWLLVHRRRDGVVFMVAGTAGVAVAAAAALAEFGTPVFEGILFHQRELQIHSLLLAMSRWLAPLTPLLAATLALSLLPARDARISMILIIAGLSLSLGLVFSLGEGVSYNAFFDLVFTAAIGASVFIAQIQRDDRMHGALSLFLMGVLAAGVLFETPLRAFRLVDSMDARPARVAQSQDDLAFLRSFTGPVLCESAALCYWAGKPYEVDFFNYGQRMRAGADDGQALIERIRRQEFAVVQAHRAEGSPRLDSSVNAAILEAYQLTRSSEENGFFFLPRASAAIEADGEDTPHIVN